MEHWKRKLRMGMVGGGPGAFIGAVHRLCAAMDGQVELVAGCFSQSYEKTKQTGEQLYLDPARCYASFEQMATAEAKLSADTRIEFVNLVTPNAPPFDITAPFP